LGRISEISVFRRIYFLVFVLLVAGCSLEKKNGVNRTLQNLTAHYNILFDANELLRQKQDNYALSFVDSYNDILSVYQDTAAQGKTADKDLEEVKIKGGKIINIKEQSHYLGDAYLVLGKANYLEGDYFQAVEFFSYVIRSFPNQTKLTEEALVWKARTMIRLNQLPQAKLVVDSAILNITKKTRKRIIADVYATKLQYDIDAQEYEEGEQMAKQAVHYSRDKKQRLRWTFILGQLQELNKKPAEAYKNYSHIVNSNALFEMAFNANLNRIRIQENQNGAKVDRITLLKSLIKNENNKDFIDQIYYQIAELNYNEKNINEAIKNYRLSVRYSRKNQDQKGLSYLRLADIFFKDKADYISAKKYYDSTLFSLSPGYPGYIGIKKKSDNLQLLADRYGIIAREDTLQMLAKLDDKARATKIDAMVNAEILKQQAQTAYADVSNNSNGNGPGVGGTTSSFYFYNSNAISQGYNDFKRRWGNRKLEDNWRRSNRNSSDITSNNSQNIDPDAPADAAAKGKNASTAGDYRKQLTQNIPLTPELLAKSNTRVYNAYFDIANFYRDVLGDKPEAIAIYELLLARFPNSPDKPALYYSLYRLYADSDPGKSEQYKSMLLKNYPDTPFAKIILDPDFSKKLNDADAELTGSYNQIYDAYAGKDYKNTISLINTLQKQRPDNKWASQLDYLKVISEGHLEKFDTFRDSLTKLAAKYPNDRLITPLAKQHIAYLDTHKSALTPRPFVLTDKDPNEEPFIPPSVAPDKSVASYNAFADQQAKAVKQAQLDKEAAAAALAKKNAASNPPAINQPPADKITVFQPVKTQQESANKVAANAVKVDSAADSKAVISTPKRDVPSIFSMRDSTNYYFVINVGTATTNLASSRFGIGQFNRANFANNTIKHQLIDVGNDNQLIYVGRFYSLADVKDYARAIIPLLPDIMKVPKNLYGFFIITQENLDKLKNKTMLDSYMDYYQNNY
jgi:tetratricopeptide (TPR) repeat protein